MFHGPGLRENSVPPSHRGRRYVVMGKTKAQNFPIGYDTRTRASGTTDGAGDRKLKYRLRALVEKLNVVISKRKEEPPTFLPYIETSQLTTSESSLQASPDRRCSIQKRVLPGKDYLLHHLKHRNRNPSWKIEVEHDNSSRTRIDAVNVPRVLPHASRITG